MEQNEEMWKHSDEEPIESKGIWKQLQEQMDKAPALSPITLSEWNKLLCKQEPLSDEEEQILNEAMKKSMKDKPSKPWRK